MSEEQQDQPKKITRQEADRLNNYAQGLDDKITHVVDYGGLESEPTKPKKQQRKK
jgi:hypothetical protein